MSFIDIINEPSGFDEIKKMIDCYFDLSVISIEFKKSDKLRVSFKNNKGLIEYYGNYAYRGFAILCERLNNGEEQFEVSEKYVFEKIGVMYDVSRNAPLNIDTIKKRIAIAAIMGFDSFMLYTEDMYELDGYPYFGYQRGRYTKEEIRQIDEYARLFGIDLVPCMQGASHLEHYLRWRAADDVKDTDNCLMAGEEKTYELLETEIKFISECFTSKRIFIGMDEANDMGCGKYLIKNGERKRSDIYFEHLYKVCDIVKKYGLVPVMWDDILVKQGSKINSPHDDNSVIPDKEKGLIPEGTELMYWDYYSDDYEHYKKILVSHKKAGYLPSFMGGGWTWSGLAVKQGFAEKCIMAALKACKEEGVKEVWISLWGDSGGEIDQITAANVMQTFSECSFGNFENIKKDRLNIIRDMFSEMFDLISEIDEITPYNGYKKDDTLSIADCILYQDVLYGLHDKVMQYADFKGHYGKIKVELEGYLERTVEYKELLQRYITLLDVLMDKCEIGIEMKKYYDNRDKEKLYNEMIPKFHSLKEKIRIAWEAHRKLWFKTNKPFGWEVFDARYGVIINRINTAIWRLEEYVCGNIDKIDELEDERLHVTGDNHCQPIDGLHINTNLYFRYLVSLGDLG